MHLWELLLYCTSHNCENYQFYSFYKMPKKSQIASHYCKNYLFYTFHLVAEKSPHITAKMANFIFSTHCPENHYCKSYQFYIFHPLARKPLLRKLPILYLPLSAKKNMTAKIINFIFTAQCQEKHDCKNHQFYISRPDPRKKLPILYFPPGAQKILKFIPTDCLSQSVRREKEKRRSESKYLKTI